MGKVKWWRVGVALFIVFASAFAAVWAWAQYMAWQEIRAFCSENPNLAYLPQSLPDEAPSKLEGQQVHVSDLSLQVPWKGALRSNDLSSSSIVSFKDGPALWVSKFAQSRSIEDAVQKSAKTKQEQDVLRRAVGSKLLGCCYELMASELEQTPAELHWWNMPGSRRRIFFRLVLKNMDIERANAIYRISAGEMRGFQLGNPAVPPYDVKLELFDRDDRSHEITISQYRAGHPLLTQAELNAIVASIRLDQRPD